MPVILGLDPSIKKAGYCLLDSDAPFDKFIEKGRLKTSGADGILVQRLLLQEKRIRDMIIDHKVSMVSMEAPYFGGNESEHLFALNQFLHKVFLDLGTFVIVFPPQQLKKLAVPDKKVTDIAKPQMIAEAKKRYHLQGKILPDDEADAMHAAHLGKLFYKWHFDQTLSFDSLHPFIQEAFAGKKTFTRGEKAGVTEYYGLIYRELELFFDFKRIAERASEYGNKQEVSAGEEGDNDSTSGGV